MCLCFWLSVPNCLWLNGFGLRVLKFKWLISLVLCLLPPWFKAVAKSFAFFSNLLWTLFLINFSFPLVELFWQVLYSIIFKVFPYTYSFFLHLFGFLTFHFSLIKFFVIIVAKFFSLFNFIFLIFMNSSRRVFLIYSIFSFSFIFFIFALMKISSNYCFPLVKWFWHV